MSESFGARLRQERERRHIDLASIAANTKIKAALFEGLERDDVSRWPAGIFRRSFMRAYASAIGLDPEPIVREFLERFPDPAEPPEAAGAGSAASADGATAKPETVLRLRLAETGGPFAGGAVLTHVSQRWAAITWDTGVVIAIAVTVFIAIGEFWSSLSISMLCYYLGGVLILGNTPGVCLFAPRPHDEGTAPPTTSTSRTVEQLRNPDHNLTSPSAVYRFSVVRRAR